MADTPSMYEWQAEVIENTAHNLAHYLGSTRSDRLEWQPELQGCAEVRSALAQIAECEGINRRFAAILRGETPTPPAEEPYANLEDAQARLRDSARELADAVRALDGDAYRREFPLRMGPRPGAWVMDMPVANMNYHIGQICTIQLLYGDEDYPMPPARDRSI